MIAIAMEISAKRSLLLDLYCHHEIANQICASGNSTNPVFQLVGNRFFSPW
jgi:hypothetical protein